MARLALRSVSKRYGETFAVSSVTLEVHDRELFVIVGSSGSGKTTLLRLVAGLESSDGSRRRPGTSGWCSRASRCSRI